MQEGPGAWGLGPGARSPNSMVPRHSSLTWEMGASFSVAFLGPPQIPLPHLVRADFGVLIQHSWDLSMEMHPETMILKLSKDNGHQGPAPTKVFSVSRGNKTETEGSGKGQNCVQMGRQAAVAQRPSAGLPHRYIWATATSAHRPRPHQAAGPGGCSERCSQ